MNRGNAPTSSWVPPAGPSRSHPTNGGRSMPLIDLTGSSDEDDVQILPTGASLSSKPRSGALAPTTKPNVPPFNVRKGVTPALVDSWKASAGSASNRIPPSSSSSSRDGLQVPSRKRKGEDQLDAISIGSADSSHSHRPKIMPSSSSSTARRDLESPRKKPVIPPSPVKARPSEKGSVALPSSSRVEPRLGERSKFSKSVSREKVELGGGSSSTSASSSRPRMSDSVSGKEREKEMVAGSSKRAQNLDTVHEGKAAVPGSRDSVQPLHPMFTQNRKVPKPVAKSSPLKSSTSAPSFRRTASSTSSTSIVPRSSSSAIPPKQTSTSRRVPELVDDFEDLFKEGEAAPVRPAQPSRTAALASSGSSSRYRGASIPVVEIPPRSARPRQAPPVPATPTSQSTQPAKVSGPLRSVIKADPTKRRGSVESSVPPTPTKSTGKPKPVPSAQRHTTSISSAKHPTPAGPARSPSSGEKRKRDHIVEDNAVASSSKHAFSSKVAKHSPLAPAARSRSEPTANQPPVNYKVPTMGAPDTEWARKPSTAMAAQMAGSPARARRTGSVTPATSSSALSSAPGSSHLTSAPASSSVTSSPGKPVTPRTAPGGSSRKGFGSSARPLVRTISETSSLTSLSSQPTPKKSFSGNHTPRRPTSSARLMDITSSSHRSPYNTPSKTPRRGKDDTTPRAKAKTPEDVIDLAGDSEPDFEIEEQEVDLLAEFAEFEFAPQSPPGAIPPATPGKMRIVGALSAEDLAEEKKDLLVTPTRAAMLKQQRQNTPSKSGSRASSFSSRHTPSISAVLASPKPKHPALSPGAEERKKRAESMDRKIERDRLMEETKEKARAAAEEEVHQRRMKWAADAAAAAEQSDDDEVVDVSFIASATLIAAETRKSHRQAGSRVPADSPPPAAPAPKPKKTAEERATERLFSKIAATHEQDTSFEMAFGSSNSGMSESPEKRPKGAQPYPTPTSRDPSTEPAFPGRDAGSGMRTMAQMSRVSLRDLNDEDRGAAEMVLEDAKEAEAAAAALKAEVRWAGVWQEEQAVLAKAEKVDIATEGVYKGGMWGTGIKSAQRGDYDLLLILSASSKAISQLDAAATPALATFCLQTFVQKNATEALACLLSFVDSAKHHPLQSSSHVRDTVFRLFASMGMRESVLPTFTPVADVGKPRADRDNVLAGLAELLTKLAERGHLLGQEAVELARVFCLLYADPTTSPATKDAVQAALKAMWPACLDEVDSVALAMSICNATDDIPAVSKREVLYAIGMSSEQSREISRWVAAGLLAPDSLGKLPVDEPRLVPLLPTIHLGIMVIIDELSEDTPDHMLVDHLLAFLYEMLGDVNPLVDILPMTKEREHHDSDRIRVWVLRADAMIKRTTKATTTEISNKIRLGQLASIVDMKIKTAFSRRRDAEDSAKRKAMAAGGKGLEKGQGGQSRLSFGKRLTVSTGDSEDEEEEEEEENALADVSACVDMYKDSDEED